MMFVLAFFVLILDVEHCRQLPTDGMVVHGVALAGLLECTEACGIDKPSGGNQALHTMGWFAPRAPTEDFDPGSPVSKYRVWRVNRTAWRRRRRRRRLRRFRRRRKVLCKFYPQSAHGSLRCFFQMTEHCLRSNATRWFALLSYERSPLKLVLLHRLFGRASGPLILV